MKSYTPKRVNYPQIVDNFRKFPLCPHVDNIMGLLIIIDKIHY